MAKKEKSDNQKYMESYALTRRISFFGKDDGKEFKRLLEKAKIKLLIAPISSGGGAVFGEVVRFGEFSCVVEV